MKKPPYLLRVVLLLIAAGLGLLGVVLLPVLMQPPLSAADLNGVTDPEQRLTLRQAQVKLQNDTRATLLQALAGLVLVVGATATWRQVQISRHGQITDRITRAVDQLGNASADVRVGGAYALERVARNSYEDRATVTAVLSTYVRAHAAWSGSTGADRAAAPVVVGHELSWLTLRAPDVQAAMTVLGRRPRAHDDEQLFLSYTDLSKARMADGWWCDLMCRHANLVAARMQRSRLDRADLSDTDLRGAYLFESCLVDATLQRAVLAGADLRGADLRGADLTGADLTGADLTDADLDGVRSDHRTRWPAGFAVPNSDGC